MTENTNSAPSAPNTQQTQQQTPPPDAQQLLFDEKVVSDKPAEKPNDKAAPADKPADRPDAAGIKAFLEEKLGDKKAELEGKSDEDLAKLYDEMKAGENALKPEDITTPDDMPIPDDMRSEILEIAKEQKLGKEGVQKFVDMGVKLQQRNLEFWDTTKKQWREQTEKDPEIGGANLNESVKTANQMVREFAGNEEQLKELQDDLILLGLGQKRSFIRLMNNIGKHFKNAGLEGERGNPPPAERKPTSKVFYPGME